MAKWEQAPVVGAAATPAAGKAKWESAPVVGAAQAQPESYNDSYTGINVVEFHVRKRVGGHAIEPWKIAVQVTEAS